MVVARFKASQPFASSASGRSTGFYTTTYMVRDEAVVTSVSGNYLGLDAKKAHQRRAKTNNQYIS